ncbi:MAG: DUF1289 domain-containing protein [Chromatiaceae bacterium]|uniref:DUF1289 domain-containing protein n=1 Tax=Mesotoga prima TaxID=1184387 RepID=UPI00338978D2|nr:DUF1289 domain-containing protein [Chromatiaceae bacterium]
MSIETPCKKDCLYDSHKGHCVSCGRTLDDLSCWINLSKEERRIRISQAKQRLRGKNGI